MVSAMPASRTGEVGLLKALGARRKAIMTQFLMESIVLTAIGGIIGIMLGAGISRKRDASSSRT